MTSAWLKREAFQLSLELTVLVYLLLALTTPSGGMWMPDFGTRFLTMAHLEWTGRGFDAPIPYPAGELDPELRLRPLFPEQTLIMAPDGRFRSGVGLAFPLLSWLPFKLLGSGGLVVLPLLGALATCLLTGLIAELWRPGRGWAALLLTAFATPVFFYGQLFWEHTPAVALALAGCYVLLRASKLQEDARVRLPRCAAGLALVGLAAILRREMLVAQLCATAWTTYRLAALDLRSWPYAALNALWGSALVVAAQRAWPSGGEAVRQVGSTGSRLQSAPASVLTDASAQVLPRTLERALATLHNVDASAAHVSPLWSWLTAAAVLLALVALVLPGRCKWFALLASASAIAGPSSANMFAGDEVRSVHGLVLAAPLVLAGIALARKREGGLLLYTVALAFAAAQMVILGSGPSSALEWGPRLALVLYPIAAIVLATAHLPGRKEAAAGCAALGLLVALSLGTQIRGVRELRAEMTYLSAWTEHLERLPRSLVVTDLWWLPLAVTPAYERQQLVVVDTLEAAEYLYEHAGQRHVVYTGAGRERIPVYLARYFEPVSIEPAAAPEGPALWLVTLHRRAQPIDL
jgi:hypothetical protein